MRWYWLSFADPDRPPGQRFLGVALVEASHAHEAHIRAHQHGCNPGGEVASWEIPVDEHTEEQRALFERTPKYTLLSRAELTALGHPE